MLNINTLFTILRANNNVNTYKDIWNVYRQCIRIIIDDHLPKNNYEFRPAADFSTNEIGSTVHSSANFEPITNEDKLDRIMRILFQSLRNLRKQTGQVDMSNKRI